MERSWKNNAVKDVLYQEQRSEDQGERCHADRRMRDQVHAEENIREPDECSPQPAGFANIAIARCTTSAKTSS